MINQNHPPNSLINVIQKKYNSCDGGISNIIKESKPDWFLKFLKYVSVSNKVPTIKKFQGGDILILRRKVEFSWSDL